MLKTLTISALLVGFIFSDGSPGRLAIAQTSPELPNVLIIATGGTAPALAAKANGLCWST